MKLLEIHPNLKNLLTNKNNEQKEGKSRGNIQRRKQQSWRKKMAKIS